MNCKAHIIDRFDFAFVRKKRRSKIGNL